jgi:phytoene dehydrogenase-like protein
VASACYVHCIPPSLEYVAQMFAEVRAGALPANPTIIIGNDGAADPSRVPAGKGLVKLLVTCVPYEIKDDATGRIAERDWDRAKEAYADHVMAILARDYIDNLDRAVLDRVVHSPVDQERHISSACAAPSCRARSSRTNAGRCARSPSSPSTARRYRTCTSAAPGATRGRACRSCRAATRRG